MKVHFWTCWNGAFTRISLEPNQSFSLYCEEVTSEGYLCEQVDYSHNGDEIERTITTSGRGADGYRAVSTTYTWDMKTTLNNPPSRLLPVWVEVESSVYDQYAQNAGY